MSLSITSDSMTSGQTEHRADYDGTAWRVSWLPDRPLTHSQAVTAMTIAQYAATDRMSRFVESWATELGLTGDEARRAVQQQAGASWLEMKPGQFDTAALDIQLALFPEPDKTGTPDLFYCAEEKPVEFDAIAASSGTESR